MKTRYLKKQLSAFNAYGYALRYWEDFDYEILHHVIIRQKGNKQKTRWADLVMMGDTETSKKTNEPETDFDHHNHVCAWSIAMRTHGVNLTTLWGRTPSDMMRCIRRICENLNCDEVYLYFHNLAYDWIFLRRFFFEEFGIPTSQLNVKPLYPVNVKFKDGLILKDSLILAQRGLEKWGNDLKVEHAKAVGKWDYDKLRGQHEEFTPDELTYIENDVLCGVECIEATMNVLKKSLAIMPMTATGIPRGEARAIGREHGAHDWAVSLMPETYAEQFIFECLFHGGYTHVNRFVKGIVFPGVIDWCSLLIKCFDFSSSYPFCLLAYKYPAERFWRPDRKKFTVRYVLDNAEDYAFCFIVTATGCALKDPRMPMPALASAKCIYSVDAIIDNGRITGSGPVSFWTNEVDFATLYEQYSFNELQITDLYCAAKQYLPRWFTDYVYSRYELKTQLKDGDPVAYAIEKAKLNSLYGMCAQKPVKVEIRENYATGEYEEVEDFDPEKEYAKYLNNRNTFLPYCVGIWCTSYAMRNLFTLGGCVPENELWLYSDTDSVYATGFDAAKVKEWNDSCRKILHDRGYDPVVYKGKEYLPGVAEDDGTYMQYVALHSKCYVKRPLKAMRTDAPNGFYMGDSLKITVAGVPKKGAKSLKNNIENFHDGTIFDGETSGKLQHVHWFVPGIYKDHDGNETGDSIELMPCDYEVTDANRIDWDKLLEEEVMMIDYEKEWTVTNDD